MPSNSIASLLLLPLLLASAVPACSEATDSSATAQGDAGSEDEVDASPHDELDSGSPNAKKSDAATEPNDAGVTSNDAASSDASTVIDAAKPLPPFDAGPSCSVLPPSSLTITTTCAATGTQPAGGTIVVGTYELESEKIIDSIGCGTFKPERESGTLQIVATAAANEYSFRMSLLYPDRTSPPNGRRFDNLMVRSNNLLVAYADGACKGGYPLGGWGFDAWTGGDGRPRISIQGRAFVKLP